jgi:hypothetical protein
LSSTGRKPSTERRRALSYAYVKPVLERLGALTSEIVLVSGQAVSFWVDFYAAQVPALARLAPLTTADIDFVGDRRAVSICAERLDGAAKLPDFDDHTPNTGMVKFVDAAGDQQNIDFIDQPHGLTAQEVYRMAVPVRVLDDRGRPTSVSFLVMQPVLVMESRVHNTMGLRGYRSAHSLQQLRVSVACAREYLRGLLDAGEVRAVLRLNERIFTFCLKGRDGREVQAKHGVDPFEAVVSDDDRLPTPFRETRYPQMKRELALRRARRRHTKLERLQRKTADRIGEAEIERRLRESLESVRAGRKPKKPRR